MHFDTFYQYFLFSKSWAYLLLFCIPPLFALYWNTVIYPTKDKDVLDLAGKIKSKLPFIGCKKCKAADDSAK